MCTQLFSCPLCAQPSFESLDSLRIGLVSVATRPLTCPVCNDTVLGIDKLTIHLFGHTIDSKGQKAVVNRIENGKNVDSSWNLVDPQVGRSSSDEKIHHIVDVTNFRGQDVVEKLSDQMLFVNQPHESIFFNNVHKENGVKLILQNSTPLSSENVEVNIPSQSNGDGHIPFTNDLHINTMQQGTGRFSPVWNGEMLLQTCSEDSVQPKSYHTETENNNSTQSSKTGVKNIVLPNQLTLHIPEACEAQNKDSKADDKETISLQNQHVLLPQIKNLRNLTAREKTERCNICGFHFPDQDILALHKQLVHMIAEKDLNVKPEDLLKNYPCHLCPKVFKMRGSLMVHMRVAHIGYNLGSLPKEERDQDFTEIGFNCPTCGKNFKKEQHVTQHLKTHEGKQWECDVCCKMFTTKYFLKKHKRLHSGEMPYKCNICDKTFTFQQSYHKHRLYHKDDKPHTCVTCGRSFKELSTLHNHERIHTGEKPFACETCGKCFRQRVSYLVHRRIHTGVMPYSCTACGKNFRYKVSQRTHKCPGQSEQQDVLPNLVSNIQNMPNEKDNSVLPFNMEESNKFVLIVNSTGQPILTREVDINSSNILNEDPTREHLISTGSKSNPKIPENLSESLNTPEDFFSLVISPMHSNVSSPSAEMKHLHLSSPRTEEKYSEPIENFQESTSSLQKDIKHVIDGILHERNNQSPLQTINEESLKQLLYGVDKKM